MQFESITYTPTATRFGDSGDPFMSLHRDMNRVLDEFARGFGVVAPNGGGWSGAWPHVEVNESDNEVNVVAELPGMMPKEVDVSLHDGVLTLKGEKKSESKNAVYTERWHGQFQRSLPLDPDIDPDKVDASFKNGVLTITLAKRPAVERQVRRIPITGS
jgi:HSP20 family protein